MDKHYSRKELIELARASEGSESPHFGECADCRNEFEWIRRFNMAGRPRLQDAPSGWVEQAAALAQKQHSLEKIKKAAALVFDSWAVPQPIGVRGSATTAERRLRFSTDELTFDLRAEKLSHAWAFVAQVTTPVRSSKAFSLTSGRETIAADEAGFIQWTAARPPKKILLRTDDTEIEIPELSWKSSRPR
jgi:hypothetical protein